MKHRSKCIEERKEPEFFFPSASPGRPKKGNEENRLHMQQAEAAKYCKGTEDGKECAYIKHCLNMGMLNDEPGVWGGTTEAERDILRTRQRKSLSLPYAVQVV